MEAVALLRQMLRPLADYSGIEQTWIARDGGTTSVQTIKGDTFGKVIRRYQSPAYLSGDVMLTGPNRYAYYRASTNTLTAAPPAGATEDERDKQIVNGIRQQIFIARRTGNESVAGINATIVLVTPTNPQQQGYAKFWIDPSTHIKLKVEIANAPNSKISSSELSNLTVGAAANVLPSDFQMAQFNRGTSARPMDEVKRERVSTIQDAAARLAFRPLLPGNVPQGFRLQMVQILDGPKRVGLFLRYSDGVAFFTLTEHRVRPGMRPGSKNADGPAHWFTPLADYDVDTVYRGHLPLQQEQAVRDSLRPLP